MIKLHLLEGMMKAVVTVSRFVAKLVPKNFYMNKEDKLEHQEGKVQKEAGLRLKNRVMVKKHIEEEYVGKDEKECTVTYIEQYRLAKRLKSSKRDELIRINKEALGLEQVKVEHTAFFEVDVPEVRQQQWSEDKKVNDLYIEHYKLHSREPTGVGT